MTTEKSPEACRRRSVDVLLVAWALLVLSIHGIQGSRARHAWRSVPAKTPEPVTVDLGRDPVWRLALLPGIGPTKAAAIVEDRRRRGPVARLEQLVRVHGIGPKTVEALRDLEGVRVRCGVR